MQTIEICPQTIHVFECNSSLLESIKTFVKGEDYSANHHNYSSFDDTCLHKRDEYKECVKWFDSCLEQVRSLYNYECEKLSITQMWSNKSEYGNWHHPHTHSYSMVSGIFYVTESNSKTWFSKQNHWSRLFDPNMPIARTTKDKQVIYKFKTTPGKLVLFPSHLYHSVDEHYLNEPRYSLSFNTFPSGKIGNHRSLSGLNLKLD